MTTLDSRTCDNCGLQGKIVKVESYDWPALPPDVPADKLMLIEKCSACNMYIFHVNGCDSCEDEHPWKVTGEGIANSSDKVH